MKLFSEPLIVLDTETTGFHQEAEVIELGAVCIDEWGRHRSTFSALIAPSSEDIFKDWKVKKALSVSNIAIDQLLAAPSLDEVRNSFQDWINQCPSEKKLCLAFNVKFDKRRLEHAGIHLNWGKCVLEMSREIMKAKNHAVLDKNGRRKAPSLKDSCEFFGVPYPENAHRALEDALVTAHIACKAFPLWRQLQ